jgi:hypothetical protein
MKDIVGEAILFDMYYAAVDPVALKGEKRDAPKIELLPITEETPVFRDFHITDVVCDGASKAVFIRGLPELSISNITLNNLNIQAKEGIDIQEAKNVSLTGVNLIVANSNPLINIQNGNGIDFKNINYSPTQLLFRISGDRNSAIKTSGLDATKAKIKTEFLAGAEEKSLQIN